jgi:hypothetical protein
MGKELMRRSTGETLGRVNGRTLSFMGAVRERPLVNFETKIAVNHRNEIAPQSPRVTAIAPAHFQHIAKAARGDQAYTSALALKQRIGANRCAMDDRGKRCDSAQPFEPVEKSRGFVAALGRNLCRSKRASGFVVTEKVGEGAADVNADNRARTLIHTTGPLRSAAVATRSIVPSSRKATR